MSEECETLLDPDGYIALLLDRQAAFLRDHPCERGRPPLLEWFIEPGDERLFIPPEVGREAPERARRSYRSVAELTAQRAEIAGRLAAIEAAAVSNRDPAIARVGPALIRKMGASMDGRLAEHARVSARIRRLDHKIALARRRERT